MASKRFRDAVGIDPDRVVAAAVDAAMGDTRSRGKRHHPGRVLAAGAAVAAVAAVGQRRMPRLARVPLRMGLRKLGDMTHVDELADALRDRLAGHEDEPNDDDYYDEEDLDDEDYDDEESDDDEEFDDEPRDEADDDDDGDEGFDDEDDEGFDDEPEDGDGPRGAGDEEEPGDDDPEDDTDEAGAEDEEPEDLEAEENDEDLEPEEDDEGLESDEDDEEIAARSLDLGASSGANRHRARDRVPDLFAALRTPHRRPPVMRRGSLGVDPATRPPEPGESHARDERRNRSRKPKSTAARA
jgi:hypothetical protein